MLSVGAEGGRLTLPEWGVRCILLLVHTILTPASPSLLVPQGALEPGYREEVFLAVVTEPRHLPALATRQARLR